MEDQNQLEQIKTDRLLRAIFEAEEPKTFWNGWLGKSIRWIVFIPGIYLGLAIVYLIAFGVAGMVHSWFGGKIELSFGVIVLAIIAATIGLSVGLQFVFMVIFAIGAIPTLFCGTVAPNPRLAAPIFGTIYVLGNLLVIAQAIGAKEWGALVFYVATTIAVLIGTKSAYDSVA